MMNRKFSALFLALMVVGLSGQALIASSSGGDNSFGFGGEDDGGAFDPFADPAVAGQDGAEGEGRAPEAVGGAVPEANELAVGSGHDTQETAAQNAQERAEQRRAALKVWYGAESAGFGERCNDAITKLVEQSPCFESLSSKLIRKGNGRLSLDDVPATVGGLSDGEKALLREIVGLTQFYVRINTEPKDRPVRVGYMLKKLLNINFPGMTMNVEDGSQSLVINIMAGLRSANIDELEKEGLVGFAAQTSLKGFASKEPMVKQILGESKTFLGENSGLLNVMREQALEHEVSGDAESSKVMQDLMEEAEKCRRVANEENAAAQAAHEKKYGTFMWKMGHGLARCYMKDGGKNPYRSRRYQVISGVMLVTVAVATYREWVHIVGQADGELSVSDVVRELVRRLNPLKLSEGKGRFMAVSTYLLALYQLGALVVRLTGARTSHPYASQTAAIFDSKVDQKMRDLLSTDKSAALKAYVGAA